MMIQGEPIIHEGNAHEYADPTLLVAGQPVMRGLVQRPAGIVYAKAVAAPPSIPIIPRSEWSARIAEKTAQRSHLSNIRMKADNGQLAVNLDQNGKGACWAHSSTQAVMMNRAACNMPYIRLSAYGPFCVIKQYRDEGGWAALSMDFLSTRGVPSCEKWPEQSMSRSNDNPATWEDAARYKVTEGFWDSDLAPYDRKLTFEQRISLLLCNQACASDYMWWGHSVCDIDAVDGVSLRGECRAESGKLLTLQEFDAMWDTDGVTGGIGVRILNSWLNWGLNGTGTLAGTKAMADGSVCPLVSNAA